MHTLRSMLCLSQTTGYAIAALAQLEPPGGAPRLLKNIARQANVPAAYLAKRMPDLVAAGLVSSKRGKRGGLVLARPPAEITLKQVNEAIEGRDWSAKCLLGLSECSDERACPMHEFWKETRSTIEQRLAGTTLADVIAHDAEAGLR